jgi:general secretion pathway protein G
MEIAAGARESENHKQSNRATSLQQQLVSEPLVKLFFKNKEVVTMRTSRRQAFTLIEILIVVVIMAVLAATIIPQFSSSADDAKQSSVDFTLHTLRSQIELYKLHHTAYPAITAGSLPQMLNYTDKAGNTNATADPSYPYSPYVLDDIPANPFTGKSTVTATGNNPPIAADIDAVDGGWLYDATTGEVWAGHSL